MKTEVLNITPEMAKEFLSRNKAVNRPINKRQVEMYCDSMKRGQWKLTGQSIQISEFGNLIDGQHRLTALIKADVTLPFLVVYEVRESSFHVLDQGLKRGGSDVLAIQNVKNSIHVASIIAAFLQMAKMENGMSVRAFTTDSARRKITNSDILDFYNSNKDQVNHSYRLADRHYGQFRIFSKTFYGSLFLFLTKEKKHSYQKVEEFLEQLSTGQNCQCQTILVLRQKLINSLASNIYKIDLKVRNKMVVQTWNDYISGKNDKKTLVINHDKKYSFL